MQTFPIDFLIKIKNASRAGQKKMTTSSSKFCINIANLLKRYGYIDNYSVSEDAKTKISVDLIYQNNQSKITDIKIFSKPSRRIYRKYTQLPWGKTPYSLIIISTSSGVMSQKEAKTKKLGGEIIAEIF